MGEMMLVAASAGFLGGFVRALYGLLKATTKGVQVHKWHFIITLIVSAFLGAMLGLVFDSDYRYAALAGYVGTDILENIFKGSMGKKVVVGK
jgi:hypothetical protein